MNLEQRKEWNKNHKLLTEIILNPEEHARAIELFLTHHASLYTSKMENASYPTLEDEIWVNFDEAIFRTYRVTSPDTKNSIAWHLWHIARIEDMTMNILVADDQQVLHSANWLQKLNIRFSHSGNEMKDEEIAELSSSIDLDSLLQYRIAVGRQTRRLIASIEPKGFREKVQPSRIKRLFDENAVIPEAKSIADYWSKKTIAGLVLMPATRHNFLHMNKCIRIRNKLQKANRKLHHP